MRRLPSLLLVVGGLALALAVPVGLLNRTVLDAPTFADKVDQLRQRDDMSTMLGTELSDAVIARNPNLVAIAPLVQQISISVMGSDALSGPVKVAARQFNTALTTGSSDQIALRIADVGAVVASVVGVVAPERAPNATNISTTLADVGSQSFADRTIRLANLVDTLAWLLPLVALICLGVAVALDRDRWNAVRRVGRTACWAAGVLAVAVSLLSFLVRRAGADRTDVLLGAVWDVFVRPIWWPIGLLAAIGAVLVLVASGRSLSWNLGALRTYAATPRTRPGLVVRGVVFMIVGLVTVLDPLGVLRIAAFVAGALLLVAGFDSLAALAPRPPASDGATDAHPVPVAPRRRSTLAVGLVCLVIVGGLVVWASRPPRDEVAGAAGGVVTGDGKVCNGHAELCTRRFDEVSYAATHNSMSVAGKPGWFLGEQGLDILPQLDSGVRALLIDVWYGRSAGNGAVRTAARSYEEALKVANEELGPDIVAAALRVVNAVAPGEPQGPEELFMCHGLCETGATSFDDTLTNIRTWLETHPDEVLSLFIEDHVDAPDIGAAIERANLTGYAYTPVQGQPFPTLGDMIRSGRRLLVMLETGDGRPEYPWLVNGFEFTQETPYTFPTVESFSCAPNRGEPGNPLFQINHWLSGFTALVTSAQQVNVADVLGVRADECRDERKLQPTFVAVNYADIGDLMQVVDQLNGVG